MAETEHQDELIHKQQQAIEKEVSCSQFYPPNSHSNCFCINKKKLFLFVQIQETFALISDELPIALLHDEYTNDPIYTRKIQDIEGKYKSFRKVRPDGNCFYR